MMIRITAIVLGWSQIANAGMLFLDDVPEFFEPGKEFTFSIRLSDVSELASYNVELMIETSETLGAASVISAPIPPSEQYVFSSSDYFLARARTISDSQQTMTVSDFSTASVDTTPNDLIANLTVRPPAGLTQPLRLAFVKEGLLLDTLAGSQIAEFADIRDSLSEVVVYPVPEPTNALLGLIALIAIMRNRNGVAVS